MNAKKFILGMVSVTVLASSVYAGPAGKAVEVANRARSEYFGARKTAVGMEATALRAAQDRIIADMRLDGRRAGLLRNALNKPGVSAEARATRINALAHIAAVKRAAKELTANDAEAAVLSREADVFLRTIEMAVYTTAKAPTMLTAAEHAEAVKTVARIESIIPTILTKMSKAERAEYAKIESARSQIITAEKVSGAEALVKAIMKVKGVNKDGAMAYVRRILGCKE